MLLKPGSVGTDLTIVQKAFPAAIPAEVSAGGARLNTIHNLHYYLQLMRRIRAGIEAGSLARVISDYGRNETQPAQVSVA